MQNNNPNNTGCFYRLSPINLVWGPLKCSKSNFNPMHVFLHFKSFCLVVLKLILASKLSELEQFENLAANGLFTNKIAFSGKWLCLRAKCNLLSAPFLNLINGIGLFFLPHFHPLCLLAGNLQLDFQIALTHSILKLKSILIPPNKMSWSGEKHAQD